MTDEIQPPVPDTDAALAFLSRYFGDSPAPLTSIDPDGGPGKIASTTLCPISERDRLRAWLDARQGKRNIYFMVNTPVRAIEGAEKASKSDVRGAIAVHVDIDPRAGEDLTKEKLRGLRILRNDCSPGPPSIIIDSGNGVQGFWLFDREVPLDAEGAILEQVEAANLKKALDADAAGADGDRCHNIDRIMRVPGTINVPNATKRKKGRVPVLAKLIEYDDTRRYTLDSFPLAKTAAMRNAAGADVIPMRSIPEHVELDALLRVSGEMKAVIRIGRDPDDPGRFASRSHAVFHVVRDLLLCGIGREEIASILLDRAYGISESIREHGRVAKEEAIRQVDKIARRVGTSNKPLVEVRIGNLAEALDQAERVMMADDVEMFQRHGVLVRVTREGTDNQLSLLIVEPHWLLERMIAAARWVKPGAKGEMKPFDPKVAYALHYIARAGEWKVPHLTGVVTAPTLRRDMSIVAVAGYDKASGLFYDPGQIKFPEIPVAPTKKQARKALDFLLEPLRCFPFIPQDVTSEWQPSLEEGRNPSPSRSVILSAILSGVVRASLPAVPLHAIDAPEKGTGKSRLSSYISLIVTGREPSMVTITGNETEDKKSLFSVLLGGPSIIVFDNVERPIEGSALCTVLTQEIWQDRVLGQSQMSAVPTNALFMATGNNLTFRGDMTRRVVVCRMDARSEHPDEREFTFDPRDIAIKRRPELVAAALTVLRAYDHAGRPAKLRPIGSFEAWGIVREALVWLGEPDPALTRKAIHDDDPLRSQNADIMLLWERCFGDSEKALLPLLAEIQEGATSDHVLRQMVDVLVSLSSTGKLNLRSIDSWFRRNANKVLEGRRFVRTDLPGVGVTIRLDGVMQTTGDVEGIF